MKNNNREQSDINSSINFKKLAYELYIKNILFFFKENNKSSQLVVLIQNCITWLFSTQVLKLNIQSHFKSFMVMFCSNFKTEYIYTLCEVSHIFKVVKRLENVVGLTKTVTASFATQNLNLNIYNLLKAIGV